MTLADPEVLELLRHDPDLLAIADAVAATQRPPRRRRPARRLASLVAAAAVLLALGLVQPWQHGAPSLVDRALAAVGGGPVLHVVIRDRTGSTLVDLASGEERPQMREIETWFDGPSKLEHSLIRIDGQVTDDVLQAPSGGNVVTCAWIQAHPAEAARAGVSCDAKDAPGSDAPTVNAAFSGFLDGYRSALASGSARETGRGEVAGRPVTWLELTLPGGDREQVAIDRGSYRPLLVRDGTWQAEVLTIETLPSGDFSEPDAAPQPAAGGIADSASIPLAAAAGVVASPLWAGEETGGLRLGDVRRDTLTTGYPAGSDEPGRVEPGLELRYGIGDAARPGGFVRLEESTRPELAYAWWRPAPPEGTLLLDSFGGALQKDGVFVRIAGSSRALILAAARALEPVSGS